MTDTHPRPDPPADSYRAIADGEEVEFKEKGSRFAGVALRVEHENSARGALTAIRKRHHSATHHCSAWRVGPPEAVTERADDDGEPSGTAGPPILSVLRGAGVHDAIVVVTRWYGGTKLGKGGLIRAYSDAARIAIDAATKRTVWREAAVSIETAYADVGIVEAILAREGPRIRRCERDFSGEPRFVATVLVSEAERLRSILVEATAGRGRITILPGHRAPRA